MTILAWYICIYPNEIENTNTFKCTYPSGIIKYDIISINTQMISKKDVTNLAMARTKSNPH